MPPKVQLNLLKNKECLLNPQIFQVAPVCQTENIICNNKNYQIGSGGINDDKSASKDNEIISPLKLPRSIGEISDKINIKSITR